MDILNLLLENKLLFFGGIGISFIFILETIVAIQLRKRWAEINTKKTEITNQATALQMEKASVQQRIGDIEIAESRIADEQAKKVTKENELISKETEKEAATEDTLKSIQDKASNLVEKMIDSHDSLPVDKDFLAEELEQKIKFLEKDLTTNSLQDETAKVALDAFGDEDYEKAINYFLSFRQVDLDLQYEMAETAYKLGNAYFLNLDFESALEAFLDASRLNHKNTVYINDIGYTCFVLAKYKEAADYFEKALESDLEAFGPKHPKVAVKWNNLGLALKALGKFKQAIRYYEKALKSDLENFGEGHPKAAPR